MPRKNSKAVPVGNGPVPQDTSGLSGEITMRALCRMMSEALGKALDKSLDELKKSLDMMSETTDKMLRTTDQHFKQTSNTMLGSHVLPRRQTYQLTRRLASVRRTLQQIKQSMGIGVLQ